MSITVHPGRVEGTVRAPGSKSMTHRAILLALLGDGGTVQDPLWSQDTLATLAAARGFGAKVIATKTEAVVRSAKPQAATIDAANSGTTLRLATGVAALAEGKSTLTGDASLEARPMGPLADALTQLGAETVCRGEDGRAPIEVNGPATGSKAQIAGDVSSQFVSALLLIGSQLPEGLSLALTTPLTSSPYVDMTIGLLRSHGVEVEAGEDRFEVPARSIGQVRVHVPGDYSAAAFPLVAGAITGGEVRVGNLPEGSGQGDEALPDLLEAFDVAVERDGDSLVVTESEPQAAEIGLGDNPDLFPPLAVLAACSNGRTRLTGAPHLRDKESDRIQAMTEGLETLGIDVEALEDGAVIEGGQLTGGTVDAFDDHRIQMAFAIAGLAATGPVTVTGPSDVHAVSYPGFLAGLRKLGASVDRSQSPGTGPPTPSEEDRA